MAVCHDSFPDLHEECDKLCLGYCAVDPASILEPFDGLSSQTFAAVFRFNSVDRHLLPDYL